MTLVKDFLFQPWVATRKQLEEAGLIESKPKSMGTGYDGARWDADGHAAKQAQKSVRLTRLLRVVRAFLAPKDDSSLDLNSCKSIVDKSVLLKLLLRELSNDSFTDMCKRADHYFELCRIVRAVSKCSATRHLCAELQPKLSK